jgi:hypothetical protein
MFLEYLKIRGVKDTVLIINLNHLSFNIPDNSQMLSLFL